MTLIPVLTARGAARRDPILTPALARVFIVMFGATFSFYLLFPAVPAFAGHGPGGQALAGLTTGVLMVAAVIAEFAAPVLEARFGRRDLFVAALLLMGLPCLVIDSHPAVVLCVCAVRGLGFGLAVVMGSALAARLAPPTRRGEALGLYGVVVGLPAIAGLPLAVWFGERFGYGPVFAVGGLMALAALPAALGLPRIEAEAHAPSGVFVAARRPALAGPVAIFAVSAMAIGVAETFLPLIPAAGAGAALGLFVQPLASTVARWWAGRQGDRGDPARQLAPGMALTAAGLALLAGFPGVIGAVAGMAVMGIGFGLTQNASMASMYARASAREYAAVSALWNLAYDAAMGVGAAAFGFAAGGLGYAGAFIALAGLTLAAAAPAWRASRAGNRASGVDPTGVGAGQPAP